jgi:hypothetical protein
MYRFNRSIAAVAFAFAAAPVVGAQTVAQAGRPTTLQCDTNASAPGAFRHCALSLEHMQLKRGGDVVSRAGLVRPIKLTRFVTGDSAQHYARAYERDTRRANTVMAIGTSLALTAFMANRMCNTPACMSAPHHSGTRVTEIVGVSLVAFSIPLRVYGRHQGYKAVAFHNDSLGR